MPSSFKGIDLFGSGPHRFAQLKQGVQFVNNAAPAPGTTPLGKWELVVVVTGRLIAASEAALWSLRDAVTAQLLYPIMAGTLIDLHGRTWTGFSFVTFTERDRVDRGRVRSLGYVAEFRKFTGGGSE